MNLKDNQTDILVRHYKAPLNKGRLSDETAYETAYNPKCGDVIHLSIRIDSNGLIKKVMFDGHGCMICLASASILTDKVNNLSTGDAHHLINTVEKLLKLNKDEIDLESLPDDIQALSSVRSFPTRTQCVTLAWHALRQALK
ncbi:MAG: SUF system NifU family Fe-S cluster assembly protein [Balneolales bacterium]